MLVRLRLDAVRLTAGIVTLRMKADTCLATPEQQRLFAEHGRRDAHAADQAFARLRAECGEQSVVRARICDAHLPAARFVWEPLEHVPARSAPRAVAVRPLVRRIYTTPLPLASGAGLQALASDFPKAQGLTPKAIFGPYIVSGGWWGGGVHRDYYFAHTNSGELQWLYYDRRRQCFFLQGQVE
jgi:protein ImuB